MISSISNTQIKNIVALQKKARERNKQNCFIVEGYKMFIEIPREEIIKAYISESFYNENKDMDYLLDIPYEVLTDGVFKEISDTQTPQGLLAIVKQKQYTLDDILIDKQPLIMILESLQDPGNLGTILRTAEAAGVSGVILNNTSVDMYNPKVTRSTMGAIFRVPFVYVDNLFDILDILSENDIKIFGAHLNGKNYYDDEDYTVGSAFLIGNESQGLSDEIIDKADTLIKIPMEGKVESLNASVAASLLMYEANRQRRR